LLEDRKKQAAEKKSTIFENTNEVSVVEKITKQATAE